MGWVRILHRVVLGRISWGYCGVRLGEGGWVEYCWVSGIVYCGIWYEVGTCGAGVGSYPTLASTDR